MKPATLYFKIILTCMGALLAGTTLRAQIEPGQKKAKLPTSNKPVVKKTNPVYKAKNPATATVKFLANAKASLRIDGEEKAILEADEMFKYKLAKGEYMITAISTENSSDELRTTITIDETGVERVLSIDLRSVTDKRIAAENRKREELLKAEFDVSTVEKAALFLNKHLRYVRINFLEPSYKFSELGISSYEKSAFLFVVTNGKLNIKMHIPKTDNCDYGVKEVRADFDGGRGTGGYTNTYYIRLTYTYRCSGTEYKDLYVGIRMNKTWEEFGKYFDDELKKYFL